MLVLVEVVKSHTKRLWTYSKHFKNTKQKKEINKMEFVVKIESSEEIKEMETKAVELHLERVKKAIAVENLLYKSLNRNEHIELFETFSELAFELKADAFFTDPKNEDVKEIDDYQILKWLESKGIEVD